MGTLKRLFNKIINKTDETKKEVEKVEEELKLPKTKSERKYKTVMDYMSAGYGFSHTNPEFHPKRTKLKGWQKEAKRSSLININKIMERGLFQGSIAGGLALVICLIIMLIYPPFNIEYVAYTVIGTAIVNFIVGVVSERRS